MRRALRTAPNHPSTGAEEAFPQRIGELGNKRAVAFQFLRQAAHADAPAEVREQ